MKKYVLLWMLFVSMLGYSQEVTIVKLTNGAKTVTFTNPAAIVVTGEENPTTGFGRNNGKIIISNVSGGTGTYSYVWYSCENIEGKNAVRIENQTGEILEGLIAGFYKVIVTDGNQCNSPKVFEIEQPEELQIDVNTPNIISCFGGTTTLSATNPRGGTTTNGIYNYRWAITYLDNTTETKITSSITAKAGTYTLTISDNADPVNATEVTRVVDQNIEITATATATHLLCKGDASGAINLTIKGGISPYSIAWSDGVTTQNRSNLAAGTYFYTITDKLGCPTVEKSVTILEPANIFTASLDTVNQPTPGQANGAIVLNVSDGYGNYSYQWKKDGVTFVPNNINPTGLANGTYSVIVTDTKTDATMGCPIEINDIVLQSLTATIKQANTINCIGDTTTLTAMPLGGSKSYSYNWYKDESTIAFSTLKEVIDCEAGSYKLIVSDGTSNFDVTTTLSNPTNTPITIDNKSSINVNCFGGNNGSASVTVSGGTTVNGVYTFEWSANNGTIISTNNSTSISGLRAGAYTVTIKDQFCEKPVNFTITQPDAIIFSSETITNVAIFGQATASITFNEEPTGGSGNYSYNWTSNVADFGTKTTKNISNLKAGIYTLTIKDGNNCTSAPKGFTIAENSELKVAVTQTKTIKCNGGSDGELTATPQGGVSPYTYNWFKVGDASSKGTSNSLSVKAAAYYVTITDAVGATKTSNEITVNEPLLLKVAMNKKINVSCHAGADGAINIDVSGGTAPYTYQWKKNGSDYKTSQDLTDLTIGIYSVVVTDSNGCTASLNNIEISQPSAPLKLESAEQINLTGFETNNGSLEVAVSGGTTPYAFTWTKDASTTTIGTTPKIENLAKGTYHLIVTDANKCSLPQMDYTITQPDQLKIAITPTPNTKLLCFGDTTAEYSATITGGVAPYTITWKNTTTTYQSTKSNISYGVNSVASNLPAGDYEVTVEDKNNNIVNGKNTFTITQPNLLSFTTTKNEVSCYGGKDGSIQLTITGGTAPYTISCNGGITNNERAEITGLSDGTYTIKVTDNNGCSTAEQTIEIVQPTQAVYIVTKNTTPTTGFGLATGKIEVTVGGGTPNYQYVWRDNTNRQIGANSPVLTNAKAAKYTLLVTDANGCTLSDVFEVLEPSKPIVSGIAIQAKCFGLLGTLNASTSGGAPFATNDTDKTYTYTLKNSVSNAQTSITGTTANFTNITAGNYTLTATDVGGIVSEAVVFVFTEPSPINIVLNQTNVQCFGGNSGIANVTATGGTSVYSYTWKQGTTVIGNTSSITGLLAGDYSVEVRDSNYNEANTSSCTTSKTFTITQPNAALSMAEPVTTNPTGFGLSNGVISIAVSGGTTPYAYTWTKLNDASFVSTNTNNRSDLKDGTYTITVVDKNACTLVSNKVTITQPNQLLITTNVNNVNCFGDTTGSISVAASGGKTNTQGNYTFTLLDTNKNELQAITNKTAVFENLLAARYFIQVVDGNGNKMPADLSQSEPTIISQPTAPLSIKLIKKTNASCPREADGAIKLEIAGGTSAYVFSLTNLDKNTSQTIIDPSSILGLTKGNYEFKVVDKNNCSVTETFEIQEPLDFGFDKEKTTLIRPILPNTNWSLNVVMIDGQSNYVYKVIASNGLEVFSATSAEKQLLISNLPKDNYTITVTDNTGCTKKDNINLLGDVLEVVLNQTSQIKCYGNGANLSANAKGGLGLLQYSWYKNNLLINSESESTLTNYGPGTYTVAVLDSEKHEVLSNSIIISEPEIVAITSIVSESPSCFEGADGKIKISATGGNGNYKYSYQNNQWIDFSGVNTTEIANLQAGNYTIFIKDTNDCNAVLSQKITIADIQPLEITTTTVINATGFGLANGSITVDVAGGNNEYFYEWYNSQGNKINQTSKIATNLAAGSYYVVIRDVKNCSVTSSLIEVYQPQQLIVTIAEPLTKIACNNDKNIQLVASFTGGVLPIAQYNWIKITEGIETNLSSNNSVSPYVGAGLYKVISIDKNGNSATSNVITIKQPTLIIVNSPSKEDVKCFGDNNGSVQLVAIGDNEIFSYRFKENNTNYSNWIDFENANETICKNLIAGNYTFQVKYKNGEYCSNVNNISVIIGQPIAPLTINSTATKVQDVTGFGLKNGEISIFAAGGTAPYNYAWYNSNNILFANNLSNIATKLTAANYYVIVTDSKGCSVRSPLIEVSQPALLETNVALQNKILCNGDNNGSLKANSLGGYLKPGQNYAYQWFAEGNAAPLATTPVLSNIGIGNYYAIVTDANGNTATSATFTLTQPAVLSAKSTAEYTNCGNANDWTLQTIVSGGTAPYNYSWNTAAKTSSINAVPAGNYSVKITDSNGCSTSINIATKVPAALDATAILINPTCFDGNDASIEVTPSNGTPPFSYLWDTGSTSNKISNLTAKDYIVAITDAKGCTITRDYTIENPIKGTISIGEDVTLCKGQTLSVNMTSLDDKATYEWTSTNGFSSNKPIVTIDKAGIYTLTITNNLGCKISDSIEIFTDNLDIDATFIVSTQVFVKEKFVIVDISNPLPDAVEWILPKEATVSSTSKDFAEMSFEKPGEYDIVLNTKRGNCTATQTKTIIVVEGEYVDPDSTDLQKKYDVKVYPNPSEGNFKVDITLDKPMPAWVKVYNLTNNLIIDSQYGQGQDNYIFDFNLSKLTTGVYFILLETQQGNKLRKIIIQ